MMVSNCPRCNESFRVPSGELPDDAYAECPWCRETFPITDVLNKLPPVLEVMTADGKPIASALQVASAGLENELQGALEPDFGADASESIDDFDSPSYSTVIDDEVSDEFDLGDSADEELNETVVNETDESWDEDPAGMAAAEDDEFEFQVRERDDHQNPAAIAPMKVSPMPARKKKSGMGGIVGIVLGGATAVPLAFGILWGLGHFGYGPFAQPEESGRRAAAPVDLTPRGTPLGQPLGVPDDEFVPVDDDPEDSAREQIMELPQTLEPLSTNEGDAPTDSPLVLPNDASSSGDEENETGLVMPVVQESPAPTELSLDQVAGEPPTSSPLSLPDALVKEPTLQPPISDEPPRTTFEPPPTIPDASPIPVPVMAVESVEIIASADRAGKMVDAVSMYQGPESERTRQLLLTYQQIATTCSLAIGEGEALRKLANKIKDSSISDDIEHTAAEWLNYSARTSEGIALIGRPSPPGDAPTITLESGKVVPVTGDTVLPAAANVLALGTIVGGGSSVKLVLVEALP